MRKANEILDMGSIGKTPVGQPVSEQPKLTGGDVGFINALFRSLQAIFPAWRQAFDSDEAVAEAKRQWAAGLIESRLTNPDVIKAGLAKARKSKSPFIPSVGQFIDWCQESVRDRIAFPSLDSVIAQIFRFKHERNSRYPSGFEIHPAAYWVYLHVDMYQVSQADVKECRRLVGIAYDEASELASAGHEFSDSPALLCDDVGRDAPRTSEQKELARQTIENLKNIVGVR